ncbi:MAG: putative DNA binding domain-containing protein [Bryobacterales bacterium]|nr:putative DNA binding domain-containing protein [Bryobacterales bacterium]
MKRKDLASRIRLGEDGGLELKEVHFKGRKIEGPKRAELADEFAAFANSDGGLFVLGVNDKTRTVTGIPMDRLDVVEDLVREVCNDSIQPPLEAGIYRGELPASSEPGLKESSILQPVLLVEIPKSLFVHKGPGGYFRRIGSSKRQIEPMALQRLMTMRAQTGLTSFDELPVARTTPEDLDRSAAELFVSEEADFDLAVRKLGLIVEDADGTARLSVGGVLLCTARPQQWLRAAYIQAVLYAGDRLDDHYQTDAQDIMGPLNVQVSEAFDFVRRNMRIGAVKRLGRQEVAQYSEKAVFEALVNAVAHRDYSIAGSRIRLHMFANRIELSVPGGLANTLTTDVLHLRQATRNPLVVSLLARCPAHPDFPRQKLMEQRGDGVPRIRKETQSLTGRLPEYSLTGDSELRLVLPAAAPF